MLFVEGDICQVAGWGAYKSCEMINVNKTKIVVDMCPSRLHEADVPIWSVEKCQSAWLNFNHGLDSAKQILDSEIRITDTNICIGGKESGKNHCKGDSGGPLVCTNENSKRVLVGIVSWGTDFCNYQGLPGINTRISPFIEWIQDIVWAENTFEPDIKPKDLLKHQDENARSGSISLNFQFMLLFHLNYL